MELIKSIAIQLPMLVAALALLIAALGKMGQERGASSFLFGSVGVFLMTILNPIVYSLVMPRVITATQMEPAQMGNLYLLVGLVLNLFWAASIILLAVGTFSRLRGISQ